MSTAADAPSSADAFVHPALFYRDESEYLAGTVPFVRDGLAAGEPVAVAVPGPNLELIRTHLGPDQAAHVRLIDMTEAGRNPGRIIPAVLRAFADDHPDRHVRIIGEPIWPSRSPLEYPACAQHEALINMAFAGRTATILCPYDAERLPPAALADAARTHPVLISPDGWRDSDDYAPEHVVADYNRPLPPPVEATTFSFNRSSLAKARRFAGEQAGWLGLPARRVPDAIQAVGELAANSIVHGGGSGTLRVWADDDHIVFEVSDSGLLRDPLAGRSPVGSTRLNGRGLLLVNLLSDLVRTHVTDSGTTTRIHFKR